MSPTMIAYLEMLLSLDIKGGFHYVFSRKKQFHTWILQGSGHISLCMDTGGFKVWPLRSIPWSV